MALESAILSQPAVIEARERFHVWNNAKTFLAIKTSNGDHVTDRSAYGVLDSPTQVSVFKAIAKGEGKVELSISNTTVVLEPGLPVKITVDQTEYVIAVFNGKKRIHGWLHGR